MPLRLSESRSELSGAVHFEVWELSGLTQREYCERHGLSLKSFGNWRGQLKCEHAVGHKARWGRYPRFRPGDSHMANPMANPAVKARAKRAAPLVTGSERRRQFGEEAKRRIVGEASRPGGSLSEVARRYGGGHVDLFCESFEQVPSRIVLDIVDTEDTVHGGERFALFNRLLRQPVLPADPHLRGDERQAGGDLPAPG